MVSVLAFYSDNPSSIPAEIYNFFCRIVVERNENKQKGAGVGPFLNKKKREKKKKKVGRVAAASRTRKSAFKQPTPNFTEWHVCKCQTCAVVQPVIN